MTFLKYYSLWRIHTKIHEKIWFIWYWYDIHSAFKFEPKIVVRAKILILHAQILCKTSNSYARIVSVLTKHNKGNTTRFTDKSSKHLRFS